MPVPTATPTFEDIKKLYPDLTLDTWNNMPQFMRDTYIKSLSDLASINNAAKGTPIPTPPKKNTPTSTPTPSKTPTPTATPSDGTVLLMSPDGEKIKRVTAEEAVKLIKEGWNSIDSY
jgi:BRCT domain type II-containing protein